jgi:hypothetical protein
MTSKIACIIVRMLLLLMATEHCRASLHEDIAFGGQQLDPSTLLSTIFRASSNAAASRI